MSVKINRWLKNNGGENKGNWIVTFQLMPWLQKVNCSEEVNVVDSTECY